MRLKELALKDDFAACAKLDRAMCSPLELFAVRFKRTHPIFARITESGTLPEKILSHENLVSHAIDEHWEHNGLMQP